MDSFCLFVLQKDATLRRKNIKEVLQLLPKVVNHKLQNCGLI